MAKAEFKKGSGPDQMQQGQATQLNATVPEAEEASASGLFPEGFDELGDELLAPTDRPDEPISHGLSWGPGPSFSTSKLDSEDVRRRTTAEALLRDPNISKETRLLASRLLQGD